MCCYVYLLGVQNGPYQLETSVSEHESKPRNAWELLHAFLLQEDTLEANFTHHLPTGIFRYNVLQMHLR